MINNPIKVHYRIYAKVYLSDVGIGVVLQQLPLSVVRVSISLPRSPLDQTCIFCRNPLHPVIFDSQLYPSIYLLCQFIEI